MKLKENIKSLLIIYGVLSLVSLTYTVSYYIVLEDKGTRNFDITYSLIYFSIARPIIYYLIGGITILFIYRFGNLKVENTITIKALTLIAVLVLIAYIPMTIVFHAGFINVRFISNIIRIYTSYPIIFTIIGLLLTLRFCVKDEEE